MQTQFVLLNTLSCSNCDLPNNDWHSFLVFICREVWLGVYYYWHHHGHRGYPPLCIVTRGGQILATESWRIQKSVSLHLIPQNERDQGDSRLSKQTKSHSLKGQWGRLKNLAILTSHTHRSDAKATLSDLFGGILSLVVRWPGRGKNRLLFNTVPDRCFS